MRRRIWSFSLRAPQAARANWQIYYGRNRGSIGTVVDFATAGQVSRRIIGDPSAGAIRSAHVYEVTAAGGRAVIVGVPGIDSNTGKVFFTASSRGPGWTPADPNPTGPPPPAGPTPTADTRVAMNRTGLYFGATNNGALLTSAQTASVMFTNGGSTWSVASDAPG